MRSCFRTLPILDVFSFCLHFSDFDEVVHLLTYLSAIFLFFLKRLFCDLLILLCSEEGLCGSICSLYPLWGYLCLCLSVSLSLICLSNLSCICIMLSHILVAWSLISLIVSLYEQRLLKLWSNVILTIYSKYFTSYIRNIFLSWFMKVLFYNAFYNFIVLLFFHINGLVFLD